MRLLLYYATHFSWAPHAAVGDTADAMPAAGTAENAVVAFIHAEAGDLAAPGKAVTKTIKNIKWLAGKFDSKCVVLHSFGHLGGESAPGEAARELLVAAGRRLEEAGYEVQITPFGWTHAFQLHADGPGLAKVWKSF